MPETTNMFEVMSTMRAMRRLKPDPVPDELINKILQAAQWAPSGGNTQRWRFLVVKDPESRRRCRASTTSASATRRSGHVTPQAHRRPAGSSIYPAVQNMLLATRALGLGCTLTTRHTGYAKEVDAIFGLPPGVHSYAILPIGWPMGRFGPLGRGPLKDVVFQDRWGEPYSGV